MISNNNSNSSSKSKTSTPIPHLLPTYHSPNHRHEMSVLSFAFLPIYPVSNTQTALTLITILFAAASPIKAAPRDDDALAMPDILDAVHALLVA